MLAFVVLPTAILSLMASRALRDRELSFRKTVETSAASTIDEVCTRLRARVRVDLVTVRRAMSDCFRRGGTMEDIESTVQALRENSDLARHIYVFMNPWGFLYPADTPEDGKTGFRTDEWLSGLRREAAAGLPPDGRLLRLGSEIHAVAGLDGRPDMYVGFEVDPGTLATVVERTLRVASGRGYTLSADGPGFLDRPQNLARGGVVVRDSLTSAEDELPDGERPGGIAAGDGPASPAPNTVLVTRRLCQPFDLISLSAIETGMDGVERAWHWRARLDSWGILLLAAFICAGTWGIVRASSLEIRRATARTQFVAGISHDLRTPVASLRVLAESLSLDHVKDPARRRQFLELMVQECEQLSRLVERVLFFVRLDRNALTFSKQNVTPESLIQEAATVAARQQSEGGAQAAGGPATGTPFAVRVEPGTPAVMVDATAMIQVLLNLLDNARRYGVSDGATKADVEVSVGTLERRHVPWGRRRRWVWVAVADHGSGIERRHLRKVFQMFYRAPGAEARNTSGVGIGLALCQRIVQEHGGWMEAESEVGKGSTFRVFLPAAEDGGR